MNLQTRISLFAGGLIITFGILVYILLNIESARIELVSKEKIKDKQILFEEILAAKSNQAKTYVYDNSYWDEMVSYAENPIQNWLNINVKPSLKTYKTNAVWIYNRKYQLVASIVQAGEKDSIHNIPVDFDKLFEDGFFQHFFVKTPTSLYEIWSAPIQPSDDTLRITPAHGFLFCGIRWDNEFVYDLARLTQTHVKIRLETPKPVELKKVSFIIPVFDYQQSQLGSIEVSVESQFFTWLKNSSFSLLTGILLFGIFMVGITYALAKLYISNPLKKMNKSLHLNNPEPLVKLAKRKNEFGVLSQLIIDFYKQKEELVDEISRHQKTENTLKESEARYRALFNSINDAIIVVDHSTGHILDVNETAIKIYGYSYTEFLNLYNAYLSADSLTYTSDNEGADLFLPVQYHKKKDGDLFPVEIKTSELVLNGKTIIIYNTRDISEKIKAEKAIRDSEIRIRQTLSNTLELNKRLTDSEVHLKSVLNNTDYSIVWVTPQKKIKTFNRVAYLTTQVIYGSEMIEGQTIFAFIQDIDAFEDYFNLCLKGEKVVFEKNISTATSSDVFWFEFVLNPIYDSNLEIIGVLFTFSDISLRKQSEYALKRNEQRLSEAERMAHLGHYEINLTDDTVFWSDETLKIYGIGKDMTMTFELFKEKIYNDDKEYVNYHFNRLIKDGREFDLEYRILSENSEIRYIHSIGRISNTGNKILLFGTIQDITDRMQAEKALAESEEKYRTVIETVEEGVGIVDPDEKFIFTNRAANIIFGFERTGLTGKNLQEFISPEEMERIKTETRERKIGKISVYEMEIKRKNGEKRIILITASPKNIDGKFIGTFGVFRDITDRKRIEDQLRQNTEDLKEMNASKDKFFGIIAHDLKNPFNTIAGFSQLIISNIDEYDKAKIAHFVEIIYNSSTATATLLENLLQWSLSQRGKLAVMPQNFSISALIQGNILLLKETAMKKNIELTNTISSGLFTFADMDMTNLVIRNLISNAIKFTPEGGEIIISSIVQNNDNIITIADNGIGIAEEDIDKLFKLDLNFSTPGTKGEKGSGLGLILCKEFIEKNNGKLWIVSKKGEGSQFKFSLPSYQEKPT